MARQVKPKREVTAKLLAATLHELNPARTVEQWLDHVNKTANNPKAFFNGNGEGLAEYESFVAVFDKDKHDKARNVQTRRR